MTQHLGAKQYVPVTDDELQLLRNEATARGIGTGLLTRVLFTYGLKRIDTVAMARLIDQEKAATKQRIRAGARVAVNARWGNNNQGANN